jgi:hypothetical protein
MPIRMWRQTLGAHFLGSHAESDKFLPDILRKKFHSREWTRRLLETGSAMLIDGNLHHDNRLGICECLRAAPRENTGRRPRATGPA